MRSAEILVGFECADTIWDVVSDERIRLLRAIKEKSPNSVYELANMLGRDLKSVNTDLLVLKEYWLVSLAKSKEGRVRVKPRVEFDKLKVEIALA